MKTKTNKKILQVINDIVNLSQILKNNSNEKLKDYIIFIELSLEFSKLNNPENKDYLKIVNKYEELKKSIEKKQIKNFGYEDNEEKNDSLYNFLVLIGQLFGIINSLSLIKDIKKDEEALNQFLLLKNFAFGMFTNISNLSQINYDYLILNMNKLLTRINQKEKIEIEKTLIMMKIFSEDFKNNKT